MPSTRSTRSSVLGKRAHQQQDAESVTSTSSCEQQLQTPESTPNPKRVKISTEVTDGRANKENIPPFKIEAVNVEPVTPRSTRSLRRSATEMVTPTRSRGGISRRASTSSVNTVPATPIEAVSRMTISTPPPTPPIFIQPLHVRAKGLLRSVCNNDSVELAGRDSERNTINDFLTSFLEESSMEDDTASTSLYISGSPGTGKTALVNSVLRKLDTDAKVIVFNCMALKNVDTLWERLLDELEPSKKKTSARTKKAKGREGVDAALASHVGKCVVILDELDHITPNSQVLASLFSLSTANSSKLRLIGIANTHTLTSSASTSALSASNNVQTLHFAPYTSGQLLDILQSRLSPIYEPTPEGEPNVAAKKFLPPPALTLLSKKIASLTGDVRSLFEVLRGAIDIAVTAMTDSPSKEENPMNTPSPSVTPPHILAALKAYTPSSSSSKSAPSRPSATGTPSNSHSEIVSKITNLGMQARLVLLSAILAARRIDVGLQLTSSTASPKKPATSPMKRTNSSPAASTSTTGIDPTQLHTYYSTILGRCDRGTSEPVSRSEFGDLVGMLEGNGLFSGGLDAPSGKAGRGTFGRTASFGGAAGFGGAKGKAKAELRLAEGVRSDEVLRALGVTSTNESAGAVQEEVMKAIWEAEKARLARDLKAMDREKAKASAAARGFFDGAVEDE